MRNRHFPKQMSQYLSGFLRFLDPQPGLSGKFATSRYQLSLSRIQHDYCPLPHFPSLPGWSASLSQWIPLPLMLSVLAEALPLFARMQNQESLELIACSSSQKLRACELMLCRLIGCNYLEVQQWHTEAAVSSYQEQECDLFDMWPLEEIKQDSLSLDKLPTAHFDRGSICCSSWW